MMGETYFPLFFDHGSNTPPFSPPSLWVVGMLLCSIESHSVNS